MGPCDSPTVAAALGFFATGDDRPLSRGLAALLRSHVAILQDCRFKDLKQASVGLGALDSRLCGIREERYAIYTRYNNR